MRHSRYKKTKFYKDKFIYQALLFFIIVFLIIGYILMHVINAIPSTEYEVTIVNKDSRFSLRGKNVSEKYRVVVRFEDGSLHTFRNTDSLLRWKWNSHDIQSKLVVGEPYRITVVGQWFAGHIRQNIIRAEPILD
ncbi:hypothetical protein PM3016_4237 [Paenibacillus mucilaginosus 3016]|uniref:DUF1523 domain-containing protein n=2 Tax=Paenibacillus mucilaginosus TaxID=61624 RepID=H6NMW9_9BACL|nr:hypothetical protein KNP414_04830 [Paenibacillus mucilaginosus KNP414]AFC31009.1 hypothetical protein PM3016_4237 [Paenibacillus mucilaginosus 3016]WFA22668.1 hypothetical protein ERY13_21330 [Paenibacillus mucilaginosus]